jgi:hypothetical protein
MGKVALLSTHDQAFRSKLLNRLGIYKNVAARSNAGRKHVIRSIGFSTTTSATLLGNDVVPFREPLNDTTDTSTDDRSLQFSSDVLVVSIPSRHEYSNRIKKFLWTGGEEIQENAERNRIEFDAEGWDYRTVLEDDDFLVDSTTWELVHPCWFAENVPEPKEEYMELEQPSLTRSQSFVTNLQELTE